MTNSLPAARGRPIGWRKLPLAPRPDSSTNVFSIERWCLEAEWSRTTLYATWEAGGGPKRVRHGGKVKVLESAREYFERVAREQSTDQAPPASSTQPATASSI